MNQWTAENIRTLRKRLGWSAADFSRRFSCELNIIQEWERGVKSPLPEQIRQLEALSFHVDGYSEQIKRSAQAEQIMQDYGYEQIHTTQVKQILKN